MKSTSAILIFFALALSACSYFTKEPPPAPAATEKKEDRQPNLVGRIASVSPDRSFVLIQSYVQWKVPTGAILASTGAAGRAANLRVTGEKLNQFAAADIQSGSLEVGDGVYTTLELNFPISETSQ